jgi:hypothetical protein
MRPVIMERGQLSRISPGGDTSALPRRLGMETLFTLRKLIDPEGLFSVTVHVYSSSKQMEA